MSIRVPVPKDVAKAYHYGVAIHASGGGGKVMVSSELYDFSLIPGIVSGAHRGLSPTIDSKKFDCSICGLNIEDCPHESGKIYDGKLCSPIAKDIEVQDVNLVDVPKDPKAFITDLLLVTQSKHYYWYGFPAETEDERFANIQSAYKAGLIPEAAGMHLASEFSQHFLGVAIWPVNE